MFQIWWPQLDITWYSKGHLILNHTHLYYLFHSIRIPSAPRLQSRHRRLRAASSVKALWSLCWVVGGSGPTSILRLAISADKLSRSIRRSCASCSRALTFARSCVISSVSLDSLSGFPPVSPWVGGSTCRVQDGLGVQDVIFVNLEVETER